MLFCIKIWMKDFSSQKLKNIKHELYFKCFWYYNIIHFTFCGKKVEYKLLNDRNRGTIERRKKYFDDFLGLWWQCRKKINLSPTFYLFPFYRLKNLFLSSLTHLNQILATGDLNTILPCWLQNINEKFTALWKKYGFFIETVFF